MLVKPMREHHVTDLNEGQNSSEIVSTENVNCVSFAKVLFFYCFFFFSFPISRTRVTSDDDWNLIQEADQDVFLTVAMAGGEDD